MGQSELYDFTSHLQKISEFIHFTQKGASGFAQKSPAKSPQT